MKKVYNLFLFLLICGNALWAQDATITITLDPNGSKMTWNTSDVNNSTIYKMKSKRIVLMLVNNYPDVPAVSVGDKMLNLVPGQPKTIIDGKLGEIQFDSSNRFVAIRGSTRLGTWVLKTDLSSSPNGGNNGRAGNVNPTGVAFYDALLLDSLGKIRDRESILKILSAYTTISIDTDGKASVKGNKHLTSYLQNNTDPVGLIQNSGSADISMRSLSSIASSVGGLDVTTIADGIAKFLVQRAKEELSVAFFTRFQEAISKPEYKDMRTIFPQTYRTLSVLGTEIYHYEAYIMVLRESFEKDLRTLPSNLPGIIDNQPDFFNNQPELKAILESAFYLAQQFQDKQHPGEIIANYPLNTLNNLDANYKAGMLTLQLVSASLHSNSGDNYWINTTELKKVFSNESAFKVYLGLLTENAKKKNITFIVGGNNLPLYAMLDTLYDVIRDADAYKAFIKGFAEQASALDKKIASLKSADSDSMKVENYYSFFVSTIDLIRYTYKLEELPGLKGKVRLKETIEKYVEVAQTAANIVVDVNRRNYSSAVVNVTMLYNEVDKLSSGAAATYTVVGDKKYAISDVMNNVLRYGSFMATITQAKTSDDVANAIEAFALPSGSARIKRETAFNVSLNAYVGGFAGSEKILNVDKTPQFVSGITAPVGIAFSKGIHHWSVSAFVSVIDLGAITAFRFQNDSIEQVPTIKLENIFSPGLFLSIGIPKTPISINGGVQIGPNLRQVNSTGTNDFSDNLYVRWSASICVDIPIFNFYTKSK